MDATRGPTRPVEKANIVLIPKPGKPKTLNNLRPISLTSCLGKLFEKVILQRLELHVEKQQLMPNMMFGFRRGVSAQDIFLILKEEVLNPPSGSLDNIILALDVHRAFDTISHETILQGLEDIGCGQRIYNYSMLKLFCATALQPSPWVL